MPVPMAVSGGAWTTGLAVASNATPVASAVPADTSVTACAWKRSSRDTASSSSGSGHHTFMGLISILTPIYGALAVAVAPVGNVVGSAPTPWPVSSHPLANDAVVVYALPLVCTVGMTKFGPWIDLNIWLVPTVITFIASKYRPWSM